MKKVFLTLLAAASLCACNGDLKDRVDTLETKVAALESKVNENVSSIAKLAEAAANAVTIASVTPNEDKTSYTIKFSDGQTAVLTNGKDAEAPVVGMKEFEGEFYWTVNGEFMTNNGAKVPVSGKTPQFKIQDGKWYVSYDGKAWDEVPVSGTVEPKLEMTETETEYVFTLGETVIKIVKEKAFAIKVKADSRMVVSGQVILCSAQMRPPTLSLSPRALRPRLTRPVQRSRSPFRRRYQPMPMLLSRLCATVTVSIPHSTSPLPKGKLMALSAVS